MFSIFRALFLNSQFVNSAFGLIRRIIIDKWLNKPATPNPEVVAKEKQQTDVIQAEAKIAQTAATGKSEQQLISDLNKGSF